MIIRFQLLLTSLLITSPLAADTYFEMDSFISSEPVALDAINDEWKGQYHPNGEKQTASIWLEAGYQKNDWSLGALYREEQQLTFSSDTADLYYAIANDTDLAQGRTYQINLDTYRFRGVGIRGAKRFTPTNKLELSLGTSLFHASNLLEGGLSGSATANTLDNYSYQLDNNYVYAEDILFNRTGTNAPTGVGLTFDVGLKWKPNQQTKITLKVKDIAGVIRWKDTPYTKAQANSNTNTVDSNGFSSVKPVLSGFEGYHSSYTQHLKPSADFTAQYAIKNTRYTASTKAKYINDSSLFAIGGSKKTARGELSLHYWPQINTLETGFKGKSIGFTFGIDNLDLSETQTVWLSLNYN